MKNSKIPSNLKKKKKVLIIFILILLLIIFIKFDYKILEENLLANVEPEIKPPTLNDFKKDLEFLINRYKYLIKNEKNIDENSPIWMMWYQGIKDAPPIVLSCIQSIILNKAKHPLIIISKYNLEKYIKLPSFIKNKFENNTFSITHFSDIVRMALLSKYGGYWIDSTYFISTPLTKVNTTFFTLKLNYCWTKDIFFMTCLWAGNFFATNKHSFIATYGYMAFLYYWKKYNTLVDYFLIDYIIYVAYENLKEFKDTITNLPFINCSIFNLAGSLKSIYRKSDFECSFNKLYKMDNSALNNDTKNLTNYEYIINEYKLNPLHIIDN